MVIVVVVPIGLNASVTTGTYVQSATVAELLAKERSIRTAAPAPAANPGTDRTLEQIIQEAVQQTVAAHGGNRAAAARQLGISRTTLWRYLGKLENGETDQT